MPGKIFINYRRGDDPGFTGRLFDRLEDAFTTDQLFIDIDSIEPGLDFVRVLEEQVDRCDIFLAVIGPNWLDARDDAGSRRLDNANDFVRIEIESGLKLNKRIIPILVNNAVMPPAEQLPESLRPFARRNAVRLTHERFKADSQGLIKQLEKALQDVDAARVAASAAAELEAKRRVEEEAAKIAEHERQERERTRLQNLGSLSPEQIAKAEELANWDFIKESNDPQDFRDHLARFPKGVTARMARTRLEAVTWAHAKLDLRPSIAALDEFLAEFPDGSRAKEATARRDRLKASAEKANKRASTGAVSTSAMSGHIWLWIALGLVGLVATFLILPSLERGPAVLLVIMAVTVASLVYQGRPRRRATKAEAAPIGETAVLPQVQASRVAAIFAVLAPLIQWVCFILSDPSVMNWSGMQAAGMMRSFIAVLAVSLVLVLWQRKSLSGTDISYYWLGLALTLSPALAYFSREQEWNWLAAWNSAAALNIADGASTGGAIVAFALVLISAAVTVRLRRHQLTEIETANYWLGCCVTFAVALGLFCALNGWTAKATEWTKWHGGVALGILLALPLTLTSAVYLAKQDSASADSISTYWFGCCLILTLGLGWQFSAGDWFWGVPSNYMMAGFFNGVLAASVVTLLSAGVLLYPRWEEIGRGEAFRYWLGGALSVTLAGGAMTMSSAMNGSWNDFIPGAAIGVLVAAVVGAVMVLRWRTLYA